MPSGQTIITNALTTLGIVEQGAAPSASDSADGLVELNDLWAAAGIDEGLIFAVQPATVATAANTAAYLTSIFTPAGPFSHIYSAVWSVASGRWPLRIVDVMEYRSHRDLATAALVPEQMYADFLVPATSGSGSVFLWPVPSVIGTLEADVGTPFVAWTLAGVYNLPQAYQDFINYALAWRLIPRFGGIVAPQVIEMIGEMAQKSEARLRDSNAFNRKIPLPATENPVQQQQQAQPAQAVR